MAVQTPHGNVTLRGVYCALSDQCENCGQPTTQAMTAIHRTTDGDFGQCSIVRHSCNECALTMGVEALRSLICVLAMTHPADVVDPDVELAGCAFFLSDKLRSPALCCQCNGTAQERLRVYRYPQYLERPICVPCTQSAIAQLHDELLRQLLVDHMNTLELSSDDDSE